MFRYYFHHGFGERKLPMMKTLEMVGEVVLNQKHLFHKTQHQPKKALKHRYERRKIREYLHLGDWLTGEMS
jgi:hypothetical protein